jgi:hypothetical protein
MTMHDHWFDHFRQNRLVQLRHDGRYLTRNDWHRLAGQKKCKPVRLKQLRAIEQSGLVLTHAEILEESKRLYPACEAAWTADENRCKEQRKVIVATQRRAKKQERDEFLELTLRVGGWISTPELRKREWGWTDTKIRRFLRSPDRVDSTKRIRVRGRWFDTNFYGGNRVREIETAEPKRLAEIFVDHLLDDHPRRDWSPTELNYAKKLIRAVPTTDRLELYERLS